MRYLEDYRILHSKSNSFTGGSTYAFLERIDTLVKATDSETILDFGCGKARHYTERKFDLYWGVEVDLYEPAIDEYSILPDKSYDGVICMSVLEHIPEDELDRALEDIFSRARKFVVLSIDNWPSKNNRLIDGQGAHVTLHDTEWWMGRVSRFIKDGQILDLVVLTSKEHIPSSSPLSLVPHSR